MALLLALLALFAHPEKPPVSYVMPAVAHAETIPASFPVALTIPQLIDNAAADAGVSSTTARAIAWCESNYKQWHTDGTIVRGPDGYDVGIFQIRETDHAAAAKAEGMDIYGIDGNLRFGMQLLKEDGTAPWNSSKFCWQPLVNNPALIPK